MIKALDHIWLGVEDVDGAVAAYEAMLGRRASGARLQTANIGLRVVPASAADIAQPLAVTPALGLMFAVDTPSEAARRLTRRGLPATLDTDGVVRIDHAATHQVAIGLIAGADRPPETGAGGAGAPSPDIVGLDHVVVRTGDPERAVALYGGRLGLDLRLDRANAERGSRLLFFVCGDLVVEVTHDLRKGVTAGPDRIWGLAWRSTDVRRSRARTQAAGIDVSEIRAGNRPGTEVFTVKSHTAGVPTLVIGGGGLARH